LILKAEAQARGITPEQVIQEIIAAVPVPLER
jgi:hypothetical protein